VLRRGSAAATASLVLVPPLALRAKAASAALIDASSPAIGRRSHSAILLAVRVPVLSMQKTSTLERDSTALTCWIRASWRARRTIAIE
jgi:hypothetical protein